MQNYSKMVSWRCSCMVVNGGVRNYIEWTNGGTTMNISDITGNIYWFIREYSILSPLESINGLCEHFYSRELGHPTISGNFQPPQLLLLPSVNILRMNLLIRILGSPSGYDLMSDSSRAWSCVSHLLRWWIWFQTNGYCVERPRTIVLKYWQAFSHK